MKLVPRLLVIGVAMPIGGLVIAVVIAGSLFRQSLMRDVDERLFAQAAVESVSLFDGPDQKPHVHLPKSPLAAEVAAFAPTSLLFDPGGRVVAAPPGNPTDARRPAPAKPGHPRFDTPSAQTRTLTVGVERPGEGVYTLYLIASLAPVDATMASFYRAVGGTVAGISILMMGVLLFQARRLTSRVRELIGFVPLLRAGKRPDTEPAVGADELAELGATLSEAAQFIHAQQSSQERFLANAAHQLRTPLAVLTTEIDLALRRPREVAELRSALEQARGETDRLTLLARKLLDFESLRVQRPQVRQVDLRQVIDEIVGRHTAGAKLPGAALRVVGDQRVACLCDPVLIAQALENLVDNALRFSPAGKPVVIRATADPGTCRLSVHDDGPGIPEGEREQIFEPFFRGSTPGSQTGLGLAFVADVARQHGGRALLERIETGTTITIELPRPRG